MLRKFLQNYVLGDLIIKNGNDGKPGPVGPQGPQGPKGDTGPRGHDGYNKAICDELKYIRDELDQLKHKLDSVINTRPNTRFADILFPNGITAQDGTPLRGNTLDGKFDYSLEYVTDGTLKIINDVQSLHSTPAYINMEVKGEGTLAIMIIQTLIHKGNTYLFKKPMCSLTVTSDQRDYYISEVNAYSITYMNNYAEQMGPNRIDFDS